MTEEEVCGRRSVTRRVGVFSDVFRGQPQRPSAAPTRQRPPPCRHQTPPEERPRVPR